jgi:hypothetical protein
MKTEKMTFFACRGPRSGAQVKICHHGALLGDTTVWGNVVIKGFTHHFVIA